MNKRGKKETQKGLNIIKFHNWISCFNKTVLESKQNVSEILLLFVTRRDGRSSYRILEILIGFEQPWWRLNQSRQQKCQQKPWKEPKHRKQLKQIQVDFPTLVFTLELWQHSYFSSSMFKVWDNWAQLPLQFLARISCWLFSSTAPWSTAEGDSSDFWAKRFKGVLTPGIAF